MPESNTRTHRMVKDMFALQEQLACGPWNFKAIPMMLHDYSAKQIVEIPVTVIFRSKSVLLDCPQSLVPVINSREPPVNISADPVLRDRIESGDGQTLEFDGIHSPSLPRPCLKCRDLREMRVMRFDLRDRLRPLGCKILWQKGVQMQFPDRIIDNSLNCLTARLTIKPPPPFRIGWECRGRKSRIWGAPKGKPY